MRLIDADAVLDELNKWEWQELYLPIHFKENIIDVLPSVTPTQNCVENALSALDCISRQAVIDLISKFILEIHTEGGRDLNAHTNDVLRQILRNVKSDRVLPPVNPQEPKTGHWIRMSDLSEQEDDRYKCSHCGNVIHHKNKMDLYTFNSWCGRCGSNNGRKIEVDI